MLRLENMLPYLSLQKYSSLATHHFVAFHALSLVVCRGCIAGICCYWRGFAKTNPWRKQNFLQLREYHFWPLLIRELLGNWNHFGAYNAFTDSDAARSSTLVGEKREITTRKALFLLVKTVAICSLCLVSIWLLLYPSIRFLPAQFYKISFR